MTIEEKMKEAMTAVGANLTISGDVLIVTRLPKKELKTKSGLVLTSSQTRQITAFDANTPEFVKIVAIGSGYYDDETKTDVALDVKPGNVIEVGKNSVLWFSSFGTIINDPSNGTGIGITRESEYRMKFENEESYNTFMKVFE